MRAVVFRAKDGWRYRIVAANNETVAQSEGYHNKADALEMARELLPPGAHVEVED